MASTFNRPSLDVAKRRPLVRSKLNSGLLIKPNARRMLINISQMSPEAQRAMTMTQEDAKENMANNLNIKDQKSFQSHGQSKDTNCVSVEHDAQIVEAGRDSRSYSRLLARPPGSNVLAFHRSTRVPTSSFETSILTGTSRSRSTLSTTERNNSVSDNTDSYYNNKVNGINNRNNFQNKDSDSEGNNPTISQHEKTVIQNSTDESNNNNISEVNNHSEFRKEEHINRPESFVLPELRKNVRRPENFVLALDRALQDNCISRLSGDITNTAGISELGKVRALDGGRLSNAQEVVVNVRYDDDRELVFHDNDEENLNNAKATSNIRINLWMEYNEGFQPEDITNEIVFTANANQGKNGQNSEAATCSDPTTSLQKPRGRSVNRVTSNRTNTSSKQTNKFKWPVLKTDLNNNKTNCKSKTTSYINGRSNSISRNGSTEMFGGIKRHVSFVKTGIKK